MTQETNVALRIPPKEVAHLIGVRRLDLAKEWCKSRGIYGHQIGNGTAKPRFVYSRQRVLEEVRKEDAELHGEELPNNIVLQELEAIKKQLKTIKDTLKR